MVFMVRQRASHRLKRAYFRIYQTSSTYIKHVIGTFQAARSLCPLRSACLCCLCLCSALRRCLVFRLLFWFISSCSLSRASPPTAKKQQHKSTHNESNVHRNETKGNVKMNGEKKPATRILSLN